MKYIPGSSSRLCLLQYGGLTRIVTADITVYNLINDVSPAAESCSHLCLFRVMYDGRRRTKKLKKTLKKSNVLKFLHMKKPTHKDR